MKVRLSLGTTVEVRGRYYKVGIDIEDEISASVRNSGEFKAVASAKIDDMEDAIQPVLTEKITNLVNAIDGMKFLSRKRAEK